VVAGAAFILQEIIKTPIPDNGRTQIIYTCHYQIKNININHHLIAPALLKSGRAAMNKGAAQLNKPQPIKEMSFILSANTRL
jgi:hypothetical protein